VALGFCALVVWDGSVLRASFQEIQEGGALRTDPVCGMSVGPGIEATWAGRTYWFCSTECLEHFHQARGAPIGGDIAFQAPPAELAAGDTVAAVHTMLGIPDPVYFGSIGVVLLLSFWLLEWGPGRRRPRGDAALLRIDLTRSARVRSLLRHPWTRPLARGPVLGLFALIVVAGLFGDQDARRNIAPALTWTVWWGGLVILILYAGKAWCYVCPWDTVAGWAQELRRLLARERPAGRRWPRALRNVWPATILFVLLTWVEIGLGVTLRPRATALLALLIVALAVVSALLFDRRPFCRHACLIGRISGLYALFAPVEVRASRPETCLACESSSCLRGSRSGAPCPTALHLARLDQNTYCTACLECLKTCEQENVSLNLRPWGEDLAHPRRARADEAYLSLLMLSLTAFHGLTMTGAWARWMSGLERSLGCGSIVAFTLGMLGLTCAPVLVYALLVVVSRWATGGTSVGYREYFIRYAYSLLPLALFYHLAHNCEHLLMEGARVVSLLSDPLGLGWNLLGTAGWSLPPLLRLSSVWGLQVSLVLIGHVYGLWVAGKTARALFGDHRKAIWSQVPMLAAMVLFSVASLWLLRQPMEMRTSAM